LGKFKDKEQKITVSEFNLKPDEAHHLPVSGNISHRLSQAKDRFEQKKQQLKAAISNGTTLVQTKLNTRY
jgi:hypothetical protein